MRKSWPFFCFPLPLPPPLSHGFFFLFFFAAAFASPEMAGRYGVFNRLPFKFRPLGRYNGRFQFKNFKILALAGRGPGDFAEIRGGSS